MSTPSTTSNIGNIVINVVIGLLGTAVLTVGISMINTMNDVRQDVAVMKNMISERDKLDIVTRETLKDHELRLRIVEQLPPQATTSRRFEYRIQRDSSQPLFYR